MIKFENLSILIIEDEFISLAYLSSILKELGIKSVFKASSSDEAVKVVINSTINIAFMDINIKGGIDGIQCASLLNKEYFIPIIFTTAYKDTYTINEAKNENIFGYLIKPFEASDVEAALNVAVSNISRIKGIETRNIEKEFIKKGERLNLKDDFVYDFDSKTLTSKNVFIKLSKKEICVFDILCRNINKIISYEQIKDKVWLELNMSDIIIRDIIYRIKKKIPHININNISNMGYILRIEK